MGTEREPQQITRELATFAAELRFDDIPADVVQHAKLCLLDTIGCGLYGTTLPWVAIVRDTVLELGDSGPADLWASGSTASAPNAALVNGTAIHSFELDDLHPRSILHPGAVVVSSALAAASLGSHSGRDLLTAMVAGYEVGSRVGMAMGAAHLLQGWHPTGTHGTLASAAAAGSILGLDPEQMVHAIGTAGSQSAGLMAAQYSSMVKRLHAGHAAQAGLMSALLARRGFLGIPDIVENPYGGYLSTFSPRFDPDVILQGLGEDWQISRVGFKPYSTNGSCHPTIDALRAMRATESFTPADVERVEIHCSTATLKHVGWEYQPNSVTTAQMNLPYIVAVVLTDGDAFVDQFTAERIVDPALVELSRRVSVHADAEIDAGGDAMRHATRVAVHLRDGRVFRDGRTYARGSSALPLSSDEVRGKFDVLAGKALPPEDVARVLALIDDVEQLDDLRSLARVLAG
jgi:2-methylcitrate dehydratase PrpD